MTKTYTITKTGEDSIELWENPLHLKPKRDGVRGGKDHPSTLKFNLQSLEYSKYLNNLKKYKCSMELNEQLKNKIGQQIDSSEFDIFGDLAVPKKVKLGDLGDDIISYAKNLKTDIQKEEEEEKLRWKKIIIEFKKEFKDMEQGYLGNVILEWFQKRTTPKS